MKPSIPALLAAALVAANASASGTQPAPATAPTVIRADAPRFPEAERKAGHIGRVQLRVHVDAAGKVAEATVAESSGRPLLDAAARKAALAWTFAPARAADGTAMQATVVMPVDFHAHGIDMRAFARAGTLACGEFVAAIDAKVAASPSLVPAPTPGNSMRRPVGHEATVPEYVALIVHADRSATIMEGDDGRLAVLWNQAGPLHAEVVARCRRAPGKPLRRVFEQALKSLR